MPENRDKPLMINLERTFYELIATLCTQLNMSMSTYMRQLALVDLNKRGLLTKEVLTAVLTGTPMKSNEDQISNL